MIRKLPLFIIKAAAKIITVALNDGTVTIGHRKGKPEVRFRKKVKF